MPHQPTRLPYGLSFVKPGAASGEYTFVTGDLTPDVSYGTYFIAAQSQATITTFDGGELGKLIYVRCISGGVTIIQNSAGGIRMQNLVGTASAGSTVAFTSGGNATMLAGETLSFAHNGTDWSLVGSRFVMSAQV